MGFGVRAGRRDRKRALGRSLFGFEVVIRSQARMVRNRVPGHGLVDVYTDDVTAT